jgi:pyrroline-5-carboxylate reductase
MKEHITFIGGGNMAIAILGGLIRAGFQESNIDVVEPLPEARERLSKLGVKSYAQAGSFLAATSLVIWAVKPQIFCEAAQQVQRHTTNALHLSIAAGIPSKSIAQWVASERVIRTMPNTPALIGKGVTALFARAGVTAADKVAAETILTTIGEFLWVSDESQLDAVTAMSGSGPAYIFYFMEAMTAAGVQLGLSQEQAKQLTIATFVGAAALADSSAEPPDILRHRVTSKGGTTDAAIKSLDDRQVNAHFVDAIKAAKRRAQELGAEFGSDQ